MDPGSGVRWGRSGEEPLRHLVAGVFGTKRWNTVAALGLIVAVSLTEGMAVLLLLPLLQLAGVEVHDGSLERIASPMRAMFSVVGIQPTLAAVLAAYVIVTAMEASLVRMQSVLNARVVQAYADELRTRLYGAISRAEWLALSRIRSSDFTFALTTAIDRVSTAANQLLFAAATAAVTAIYIALALLVSPAMSAVVLGAATLLILSQHRKVLGAKAPGEQFTESTADLYATAAEQLGGLKTAKSYNNEERHVAMFLETGRAVDRAGFRLIRTYADLRWQQTVGSVIALAAILYMAVTQFHLGTAAILLLLFMFSRIVPRLATLQQSLQNVVGSLPALRTIRSLISRCERSYEQGSSVKVPIQAGQIELRGLSFAYGGNGKPTALSAIDLVIADGKTTAIVGSSGAGKTTLADLLLGLIRPQDGAVLVGGVALDPAHLQSWRSQIGYVAQDTYLFNDSVRANLSWAKPDATLEEMEESLRQAAADEFVGHLPDGIDTVIGERGVRLSGGEKQRLSLARALLRKPSLLILDEATNALDSENEQRIYDAINSLHGEMTIVVITHRLTTIRAADLIHVLDRGRLVASGDWDSLMADGDPRFRQLCLAQGIAEPSDLALS